MKRLYHNKNLANVPICTLRKVHRYCLYQKDEITNIGSDMSKKELFLTISGNVTDPVSMKTIVISQQSKNEVPV